MLCRACVACALTAGCTATTTQPDAGSTPDASAGADAGPVLCDALSGELLPRPPSSKRLRDICGLASTGGQQPIGDSAWSTFRRDRFLDAAVDLGGVMIRRDVRWSEIERIRGTFDFSVYDTMLDEMDARGIRFLGNLAYGNPWATSTPQADEFFPPDDPQDFARFAGETARHFAGRVVAWEIWNEPNAGFRFWKGVDLSGDPYAYADLLAAAGQAIHEADPTTPVMLGGTVFTPQYIEGAIPWLDAAWRHRPDLGSTFEIAGIHTYQSYPPTVAPEIGLGNGLATDPPLADKVAAHSCLLQMHHAPTKAIWITEMGWPVFQNIDEATHARFMVRSTLLAAKAGVDGVFWYTLRDGPDPTSFPPEDAFGLQHNDIDENSMRDASPKPAYGALKAMLTLAGDLHVLASPPPWETTDVQGVMFGADSDVTAAAGWTLSGETQVRLTRAASLFRQDGSAAGTLTAGDQLTLNEDVTWLLLE